MGKIKVISFDVEGTLATPEFSLAIWYEGLPSLYARRNGISFQEAKTRVEQEYEKLGPQRIEWYDINYWFEYFQLGDYRQLLENYRHRVSYYHDTMQVLSSLARTYTLIVISSASKEFLQYLLCEIDHHFARVFSSISDYQQLKTRSFYLDVCQEMNVLPEEMPHIGDNREFDFTIPKQIGINALHLDRKGKTNTDSLTNLWEVEPKLPPQ